MTRNTFLITGASDGIGAVYAERLAKRGHDLILVARRAEKLKALAAQLEKDHHIAVEVLSADLSRAEDLEKVWCSSLTTVSAPSPTTAAAMAAPIRSGTTIPWINMPTTWPN